MTDEREDNILHIGKGNEYSERDKVAEIIGTHQFVLIFTDPKDGSGKSIMGHVNLLDLSFYVQLLTSFVQNFLNPRIEEKK